METLFALTYDFPYKPAKRGNIVVPRTGIGFPNEDVYLWGENGDFFVKLDAQLCNACDRRIFFAIVTYALNVSDNFCVVILMNPRSDTYC
jgi:hypothetical protein